MTDDDGRLYCVRFKHFYFTGWASVGGRDAPHFTVTKEKALAFTDEGEARSAREILDLRRSSAEHRVEALT